MKTCKECVNFYHIDTHTWCNQLFFEYKLDRSELELLVLYSMAEICSEYSTYPDHIGYGKELRQNL